MVKKQTVKKQTAKKRKLTELGKSNNAVEKEQLDNETRESPVSVPVPESILPTPAINSLMPGVHRDWQAGRNRPSLKIKLKVPLGTKVSEYLRTPGLFSQATQKVDNPAIDELSNVVNK